MSDHHFEVKIGQRQQIPAFTGRHLWVIQNMYRVSNPARELFQLDQENLMMSSGPGCFWCEQLWQPTMGAHCPGDAGMSAGAPAPLYTVPVPD